jgi:hypothetical protein
VLEIIKNLQSQSGELVEQNSRFLEPARFIPRKGGGKSGGYRTRYAFCDRPMPVFLITVFAKNEKGNLTAKEQKNSLFVWSDENECI